VTSTPRPYDEAAGTDKSLQPPFLLSNDRQWDDLIPPLPSRQRLAADFCLAIGDDEAAFGLYERLCESQLSEPSQVDDPQAEVLVVSCARSAGQPANTQRAQDLIQRYEATRPDRPLRPFLFRMLDATMQERDLKVNRDSIFERVADIMSGVLGSGTTPIDLPHAYGSIDLVTYHFLSLGLDRYYASSIAKGVESEPCTMLSDAHLNQYVSKQPAFEYLEPKITPRRNGTVSSISSDVSSCSAGSYDSHGSDITVAFSECSSPCLTDTNSSTAGGMRNILHTCLYWCREKLHSGSLGIPVHVQDLTGETDDYTRVENIQLFCALWDAMLSCLRRGRHEPSWYSTSEAELGISPTELLATVSWILGDPDQLAGLSVPGRSGFRTVLGRARRVADLVVTWPERFVWSEFLTKFTWMNRLTNSVPNKKPKDNVLRRVREYFCLALDMSHLRLAASPGSYETAAGGDTMVTGCHQPSQDLFTLNSMLAPSPIPMEPSQLSSAIPRPVDSDGLVMWRYASEFSLESPDAGGMRDYSQITPQDWPSLWPSVLEAMDTH
jgi:hypothetical protein